MVKNCIAELISQFWDKKRTFTDNIIKYIFKEKIKTFHLTYQFKKIKDHLKGQKQKRLSQKWSKIAFPN